MNKCIILGRLGSDPELRQTNNGKEVCKFSVATTFKYNDTEETEWHRVVTWGSSATNCNKYLSKGSKVLVEGRLKTSSFVNKQDVTVYVTDLIASQVTFLDSKKDREQSEQMDFKPQGEYFNQNEEVPF